jgi:hypothetical protein
LVVVIALAVTSVAGAGSSTSAYGGVAGNVQASVEGYGGVGGKVATKVNSKPLKTTKTMGTLPFTGRDLAAFGIAGGLLLVFGFGLRRAARKPS